MDISAHTDILVQEGICKLDAVVVVVLVNMIAFPFERLVVGKLLQLGIVHINWFGQQLPASVLGL
jgi:hypothetical protein